MPYFIEKYTRVPGRSGFIGKNRRAVSEGGKWRCTLVQESEYRYIISTRGPSEVCVFYHYFVCTFVPQKHGLRNEKMISMAFLRLTLVISVIAASALADIPRQTSVTQGNVIQDWYISIVPDFILKVGVLHTCMHMSGYLHNTVVCYGYMCLFV